MKVLVVLLLFAACCELVADPSEGLKDLLHKLAVKNSGNGAQGYLTDIQFILITSNQRHLFRIQGPSSRPQYYCDKIWVGTEGCEKRWVEHRHPSHSFPTLGFCGVHLHSMLPLPVISQMITSHLPGFLK